MKIFTIASPDGAESFEVAVPSSWADVTLGQYLRLLTEPELPAVCLLTDITPEQLDRLHQDDADLLHYRLRFLKDHEELLALTPSVARPATLSPTYGQVQLAQKYIQQHEECPDIFFAAYLFALLRANSHVAAVVDARHGELLAQSVLVVYADAVQSVAQWVNVITAPAPTSSIRMHEIGAPASASESTIWRKLLGFLRPRPAAPNLPFAA